MRVALFGAGRIGRVHAASLSSSRLVDQIVVVDPVEDAARSVVQSVGSKAVVEHDMASALGRADAVVIAAPTHLHEPLIAGACDAHLPVFCEKPIGQDLEQTGRLLELVAHSNILFTAGFQRRFDPANRDLAQRLRAGDVGLPFLIYSHTLDATPPPAGYSNDHPGLFWDAGIHDIDSVLWLTGARVTSLQSSSVWTSKDQDDPQPSHASATLLLDNGALAVISVARFNAAGYDVRMEVHGTQGSLATGLNDSTPITGLDGFAPTRSPAPFQGRFAAAYEAEITDFLHRVSTASSHVDLSSLYESHRVAHDCDEAARRSIERTETNPGGSGK